MTKSNSTLIGTKNQSISHHRTIFIDDANFSTISIPFHVSDIALGPIVNHFFIPNTCHVTVPRNGFTTQTVHTTIRAITLPHS